MSCRVFFLSCFLICVVSACKDLKPTPAQNAPDIEINVQVVPESKLYRAWGIKLGASQRIWGGIRMEVIDDDVAVATEQLLDTIIAAERLGSQWYFATASGRLVRSQTFLGDLETVFENKGTWQTMKANGRLLLLTGEGRLVTVDGHKPPRVIAELDNHYILGAQFADADNGMAFGATPYILETNDGGHTWSRRPRKPEVSIMSDHGRLFLHQDERWVKAEQELNFLSKTQPPSETNASFEKFAFAAATVTLDASHLRFGGVPYRDKAWIFSAKPLLYIGADGRSSQIPIPEDTKSLPNFSRSPVASGAKRDHFFLCLIQT